MKWNLIFLSLTLLGCDMLQTRQAISEKEQRQNINQQVTTIQKTNADLDQRQQDVEAQSRTLLGKVEAIDNKVVQTQHAQATDNAAMNAKLAAMEEKLKLYQESILHLEQQVTSLQSSAQEAKASASDVKSNTKGKSEKETFEEAESLMQKKQWKKAILAFQQYRDTYSKGKFLAAATYKMGDCFIEAGMKSEAKSFLQEVIDKYPSSDWAKKATKKLSHIRK